MAWNDTSLNQLLVRIENDISSRLVGTIPLLKNSLLKVIVWVVGGGLFFAYSHQSFLLRNLLKGQFLRTLAFLFGVKVGEATHAEGNIQFSGISGSPIPINTILARSDGIEFITLTSGIISPSGSVLIPIECTTPGAVGNTSVGAILTLSSVLPGIDDEAIIIGSGIENGVEADTEEEIFENLKNHIQNPPMGGSENDYEVKAEEVAGIDKAFAFENRAGLITVPGSVTVVVKGIDPIVPSVALITDVKTAIDDAIFKPLGATNFVEAIDSKGIDYTISINPRDPIIEANIEENLKKQLREDAKPGKPILISHIKNAISTSGIIDYVIDSIIVESQGSVSTNANISFSGYEYPFLQSIKFNTL